MTKTEIIQQIFQNTDWKNYLEIGSQNGFSFLPIKAKYKTAVDPAFIIPFKRKLKWLLKVPSNINNSYFEEESDTFFLKRTEHLVKKGPLDLVLVDGLHTFRAALTDVLNSLKYLNKEGLIIMHDCYPPHKAAASNITDFPTFADMEKVEGWDGLWCGDVFKSIVYLRRNLSKFLDVYVINTDFGLGIVRIKGNFEKVDLLINEESFAEINKITYDEVFKNSEEMLGLKNVNYASTLINEVVDGQKK